MFGGANFISCDGQHNGWICMLLLPLFVCAVRWSWRGEQTVRFDSVLTCPYMYVCVPFVAPPFLFLIPLLSVTTHLRLDSIVFVLGPRLICGVESFMKLSLWCPRTNYALFEHLPPDELRIQLTARNPFSELTTQFANCAGSACSSCTKVPL